MVLVFNGWAAGPEIWDLCSFEHDWLFSYVELLDGLHHQVLRDVDGAVVVGFSLGGEMALKTVLEYPEKIKALVLVSATARMMEQKEEGWRGMSERRLNALKEGTNLIYGNDPRELFRETNLSRGLDFLRNTDLRTPLRSMGKVDFPIEIIQAERDGIVRPANAEFLKSVFPYANVTMVDSAEHVLTVAFPEIVDAAVNRALSAFK